MALKLKRFLEARGMTVVMTRTEDVDFVASAIGEGIVKYLEDIVHVTIHRNELNP